MSRHTLELALADDPCAPLVLIRNGGSTASAPVVEPDEAGRPLRLGDVLLMHHLISEDQLELALAEGASRGLRLGQALIELGILGQDQLNWALAHHLNLPYVALTEEMITPSLVRRVPEALLRKHVAIPLVEVGDELTVAIADATDAEAVAALQRSSGKRVKLSIASTDAIDQALSMVFGQPFDGGPGDGPPATDCLLGSATPLEIYLARAAEQGFDELRFRPTSGAEVLVTMRGAGSVAHQRDNQGSYGQLLDQLRRRLQFEDDAARAGLGRVLTIPVDGRARQVRFVLTPSLFGIALTLRLTGRARAPRLGNLALDDADAGRMRSLLAAPGGLCVAAGPQRRRNVELLYALLGAASRGAHDRAVTIEQQARYELEGALQLDLEQLAPLDAAAALSQALAERPRALLLDSLGALSPADAGRLLGAASGETLVLAGLEAPSPAAALLLLSQATSSPALVAVNLRFLAFADGERATLVDADAGLRQALLRPDLTALETRVDRAMPHRAREEEAD